jgi:hypothetical protein
MLMQATVPKPNHISTVIRSALGYVRPPRQQLSDAQITSAELTWDEVIVDTADLVADEWKGKKGKLGSLNHSISKKRNRQAKHLPSSRSAL